jgi:Kef-type K+ transport system membrane component KefB
VLPTTVAPSLSIIAQIGVILFMFLVGLELDTAVLKRHMGGVARIAGFSLAVPFALGSALALWLHADWHGPLENQTAFVLFIGTAMSITALPVLARILTDWKLLGTTIGTIAIGCAAIDDIVAWTVLGLVVGLAHGQAHVAATLAVAAAYVAAMLFGARPLLARLVAIRATPAGRAFWLIAIVAVAVLSAFVTERIGIHAVFGVFLAGVCVPRREDVLEGLERPLQRVSAVIMPAFFILIGLKTAITPAWRADDWIVIVAILAVASIGKLGASALAARTTGLSWRDAFAVGALLNTRGLVALVALDIGRNLGILSPALFTFFVVMTFVTTLATVPILRLLGIKPQST